MITDTEIRVKGFDALASALGERGAERFITLIMRERLDYTKWRHALFAGQTLEEISAAAVALAKRNSGRSAKKASRHPKTDGPRKRQQ